MRLVSDDCTGEAYGCANRINRTAGFMSTPPGVSIKRPKKTTEDDNCASAGKERETWKKKSNRPAKQHHPKSTSPGSNETVNHRTVP